MTAVMIVDDDPLLRRSLAFNLERSGYRVQTAASAEEALVLVQQTRPDLMLLDIGLPGMDGLAALRRLQTQFSLPIILLTARRRELDQVLGLELGADDYITKPFDLDVLVARINVVLRRTAPANAVTAAPLIVGDLQIDVAAHTVMVGPRSINLAPREFELLTALARRAGQVVSVDELLDQVWGRNYAGEAQVVYVHINWLRQKLETDPQHPQRLITVRGVGYKLLPQEP